MAYSSFPVEDIRNEFLALQKVENDHFVAFLDAASGTQLAKTVVDAMTTYMKNGVSHASGVHMSARETAAIVLRARDHVAKLVGANKDNIVFGANMSTLTIILSLYLSKYIDKDKSNIVIANMNHQANVKPWEAIAHEKSLEVRKMDVTCHNLQVSEEEIDKIIDEKTALVAIDFSSHITGVVHQIDAITKRAKEMGAYVIVNANHVLPYFAINFEQMNIDVLLCSAHKVFGPHLGIAVIESNLMKQFGDRDETLEPGTVNYEALVGMIEAVNFIAELGEGNDLREKIVAAFKSLSLYEAYLANYLREQLRQLEDVIVYEGSVSSLHVPIIAFEIEGLDSKLAAHYLAQDYSIHVDYGFFQADNYVTKLTDNENGIIRLSLAPYNTMEEMERLIQAVSALQDK